MPIMSDVNLIFQVNGEAIIRVTQANSSLQLRNIGVTTDHLINSVDGTPVNSAGITIVQLDDPV